MTRAAPHEPPPWRLVTVAFACLAVGTTACHRDERAPSAAAASAAAASAALPSAGSATAAATASASTPLRLAGTYRSERTTIEMTREQGRVAAWDADDGTVGAGDGTLSFVIDGAGTVKGTAAGPLGEQLVTGILDGDTLRLRLAPAVLTADPLFSGIVVAERAGDLYRGSIRASSGDSRYLRQGTASIAARPAP